MNQQRREQIGGREEVTKVAGRLVAVNATSELGLCGCVKQKAVGTAMAARGKISSLVRTPPPPLHAHLTAAKMAADGEGK